MKIRSWVDRDPNECHRWGKCRQDCTAVERAWQAPGWWLHHPWQDRRIIQELHNGAVFSDTFKEQKGLKCPWNQISFTPLLWNNLVLSANCNVHELFVGSCSRGQLFPCGYQNFHGKRCWFTALVIAATGGGVENRSWEKRKPERQWWQTLTKKDWALTLIIFDRKCDSGRTVLYKLKLQSSPPWSTKGMGFRGTVT